jgi:hypothetical protein
MHQPPLRPFRRLPALIGLVPLLALAGCGMPLRDIEAENRAFAWSGEVAACDAGAVLSTIERRFAQSEAEFGHDGQRIDQILHIRETSFRKNGRAYIPQRGCVADVILADTRRSRVHYTITAQTGAYSLGDSVAFCVEGHDHAHRAPPACARMTR